MDKKQLTITLIALVLAAGTIGYGLSQMLLERTITGSVSITSQPDLYTLGMDDKPIGVIDFGTLSNGVHLTSPSIKIWNSGNTPLTITLTRTDTTNINSVYRLQDESPYDNTDPVTLNMGDSLIVSIEIWNTISLQAGTYPLAFKIIGS